MYVKVLSPFFSTRSGNFWRMRAALGLACAQATTLRTCTQVGGQSPLSARAARPRAPICPSDEVTLISISHPSFMSHRSLLIQTIVLSSFLDHIHRSGALSQPPLDDFLLFSVTFRRRTLNSTLHPDIFWEMVKFVDLGVLYFSLVLPRGPMWDPLGLQWNLRSLGGFFLLCL